MARSIFFAEVAARTRGSQYGSPPARPVNFVLRFFKRYLRRNLPQYVFGVAMLVATNYAVVRIPTLIGAALDAFGPAGAGLAVGREIALELMLWALAVVIVRTLSRVLFFNPGRDVEFRLGVDLFAHLLAMQRPFYLRRKVGELVSMATNDTMGVRLLVGFAGLQVFNVAVAIPMHLAQMLATDAVLTLWCIGPIAIGGFYTQLIVRRFFVMIRGSMEQLARLSDRMLESYAGVGTVRAHAAEDALLRRFDERNQPYLELQLRLSSQRAFAMPVLSLSGLVATALVLWVGGDRVIAGEMQLGAIATFTTLLASLVALLMALAWVLASISRGFVAIARIDEVVSTPDGLPTPTAALPLQHPPALELRGLSFTYPGAAAPALRDIDLKLEPGQTVGIFGRTGAGKSTLINLLARVYTPPAGAVLVDGVDVRDLEPEVLWARIGLVPQKPFLFSGTVASNLRHSKPDATEDEMWEALRIAQAEDFVRAMPDGLDSPIAQGGSNVSGGQRQRLAIARALVRRPDIYLFDDSFSALDLATDARLRAALVPVVTDSVTVLVAQRVSTIRHADQILVLEDGATVGLGTHDELLGSCPTYAEIVASQLTAEEAA